MLHRFFNIYYIWQEELYMYCRCVQFFDLYFISRHNTYVEKQFDCSNLTFRTHFFSPFSVGTKTNVIHGLRAKFLFPSCNLILISGLISLGTKSRSSSLSLSLSRTHTYTNTHTHKFNSVQLYWIWKAEAFPSLYRLDNLTESYCI